MPKIGLRVREKGRRKTHAIGSVVGEGERAGRARESDRMAHERDKMVHAR